MTGRAVLCCAALQGMEQIDRISKTLEKARIMGHFRDARGARRPERACSGHSGRAGVGRACRGQLRMPRRPPCHLCMPAVSEQTVSRLKGFLAHASRQPNVLFDASGGASRADT